MSLNYSQMFSGGANAPLWFSGMTVRRYEAVISPADGEIYRRKTADGAGSTDPADDTTNYDAISYRRTLAIASRASGILTTTSISSYAGGATVASPVISAGVRTLLVSAAGKGILGFLGVSGSVARNIRFEVVLDGRTVLDVTPVFPSGPRACTLIGRTTPGATDQAESAWTDSYSPEFRRSVSVYVTPSVAITVAQAYFAHIIQGQS